MNKIKALILIAFSIIVLWKILYHSEYPSGNTILTFNNSSYVENKKIYYRITLSSKSSGVVPLIINESICKANITNASFWIAYCGNKKTKIWIKPKSNVVVLHYGNSSGNYSAISSRNLLITHIKLLKHKEDYIEGALFINDTLLIASLIRNGREYQILYLKEWELEGECIYGWPSSYAKDIVVMACGSSLFAISARNGEIVSKADLKEKILSFSVNDKGIYIATPTKILKFSVTLSKEWEKTLKEKISAISSSDEDIVMITMPNVAYAYYYFVNILDSNGTQIFRKKVLINSPGECKVVRKVGANVICYGVYDDFSNFIQSINIEDGSGALIKIAYPKKVLLTDESIIVIYPNKTISYYDSRLRLLRSEILNISEEIYSVQSQSDGCFYLFTTKLSIKLPKYLNVYKVCDKKISKVEYIVSEYNG